MAPRLLAWLVAACSLTATMTQKVKVDFYYEVSCPYSLKFVLNVVVRLLSTPGMLEQVLDFDSHPFGNAYFVTPQCGGANVYSTEARRCWESKCGLASLGTAPSSCFAGELVCQHGEIECRLNRAMACIKAQKVGPRVQMKFFICLAKGAAAAAATHSEELLLSTCAAQTGAPWALAEPCWNGAGIPNGAALIQHEASVVPLHDVVPYITVNGQALTDHDEIFAAVCHAYTGPPVAPCRTLPPARMLYNDTSAPQHYV